MADVTAIIKQNTPSNFRLGLEKQGLSRFESTETTLEIPYVAGKGFMHGLTKEQVKIVEDYYNLKFDNPDDKEDWMNISFTLSHMISSPDLTNPEDILFIGVCEQLGYLATNEEDAKNVMADFGFVLIKEGQEDERKLTLYEAIDEAIVALTKLKKQKQKIVKVAKYLLPSNISINNKHDVAYVKLREYLEGKIIQNKKDAVLNFNKVNAMNADLLYATVDFRDAVRQNIIRKNEKGRFYNPLSGTEYGKNETECIKFLLNPKNEDELGTYSKEDREFSIRYKLTANNK